ncbi:MAG: hypothetical protein A3E37_02990 [Candidatus Andersenbacteria bacterium RIFCSPHIGHO2_12_FULL_46_9]|nr:MAG: hypothetical protein UW94_C0018G0014 [Parcubacteria group bacterium GW2011_GWA2_45_14]OGY35544.1 MAG: hypothetical protein A3E37_02990 [Candidatus Andersenbacteria bacterium RIFCSPHIGHO2_12_FULL_46_9]OGY35831.1 MAG: hypothetical protein A3B76_05110 [Candidatus Andersenbacteria bacterium RIFCSPHIGHO2_02_FULL_46_16]OGY38332.1 MAG: hypothetical protein A3I08_03725 [Candidatus Andersenbacteria bacterium RIFCSPLOWO2_02_FULL_46_11]HBE90648.1 hypothetical protein [Candidatus Andersenbacteria b
MPETIDTKQLIILDQALDELNEQEMRVLHRKVIERLKLFAKIKQLKAISQFSVGDRVTFTHNDERISGKVIRLNRKTVTVHTADHYDWTVSPSLVSKIIDQ